MEFNAFSHFDPFLTVEDIKHDKIDYSLLANLSPTILTEGQFGENLGDSFLHLLSSEETPSLVVSPPETPIVVTRPTKIILPPPMPKIFIEDEDSNHSMEDDEDFDEDYPKKVPKPLDPTRVWSEVFRNDAIVGDGNMSIKMKTRRDQPSELLPDRLYCSLKYEFQLQADGDFVKDLPFVMARISVVDEDKFKLIKKNNKTVVKGDVESALTHPPNSAKSTIKGNLKVQFDSIISYHHDKREVCLQISFFLNNQLEEPILTMRSVPVKIFARKPNKKKHKKSEVNKAPSTAKRKRDPAPETPNKVMKVAENKTSTFDEFVTRLDELVEFNRNLSEADRKRAMSMMFSKMSDMMNRLAPMNPFATTYVEQFDDSQFDLFLN
jgi:hypothetical protein